MPLLLHRADPILFSPGGKAKPLKAPKKAAKDLDSEDEAFLEKKRAGTKPYRTRPERPPGGTTAG